MSWTGWKRAITLLCVFITINGPAASCIINPSCILLHWTSIYNTLYISRWLQKVLKSCKDQALLGLPGPHQRMKGESCQHCKVYLRRRGIIKFWEVGIVQQCFSRLELKLELKISKYIYIPSDWKMMKSHCTNTFLEIFKILISLSRNIRNLTVFNISHDSSPQFSYHTTIITWSIWIIFLNETLLTILKAQLQRKAFKQLKLEKQQEQSR